MLNPDSLNYPYDSHETLKNLRGIKQSLSEALGEAEPVRIAIFSESTVEPIKDFLEVFLLKKGIRPVFYLSNYGKVKQDLLDQSRELAEFKPQISVIYSTANDLQNFPAVTGNDAELQNLVEGKISEIKMLWQGIKTQTQSVIIQNNFEYLPLRPLGNLEAVHPGGKTFFIRALNDALAGESKKTSSVHLHDLNYLSALVGLDTWYERRLWHLYKYPSSIESFSYIGESLSSIVTAILGKSKKLLVVDADNTIWGGTIDELGPEGVVIGRGEPEAESYFEFQSYIKDLTEKGTAIGLLSKNDHANVAAALKRNENALSERDFSAVKVNWNNKDANMAELLKELHLKPEAAVFVDDNPFERTLVKGSFALMEVPSIGDDVTDYALKLDRAYYFETVSITQEDLNRKAMFAADSARSQLQKDFASYDDFLKQLDMKLTIQGINSQNIARVVQLINKTNQFNLTHTKTNQEQLQKDLSGDHFGLAVSLADKFGDLGLIGAIVASRNSQVAEIKNWVLSCRVIGRKVEDEMFLELLNQCQKHGVKEISGVFKKTGKNDLVKDLYSRLGFKPASPAGAESTWLYSLAAPSPPSTGVFEKVHP